MRERLKKYIFLIFIISIISYGISEYYSRKIEGEVEVYKQRNAIVYNTYRVLYHMTAIKEVLYTIQYGMFQSDYVIKEHLKELDEVIENLSREISYVFYTGKDDDLFRSYAHHVEVIANLSPKIIEKVNFILTHQEENIKMEALKEAIESGEGLEIFFYEIDDFLDAENSRITESIPLLILKARRIRNVTNILFFISVVITAYVMFYSCKGFRGMSAFIKSIKGGDYSCNIDGNNEACVKLVASGFNTVLGKIKEGEKESESMTITDPLTGVYNRRYFDLRIHEEINRCVRYSTIFSISMIDIDHFKQINDTFGHQVGDAVLKEVVMLIKQNIRDTDIVARYGGEEFMVIYPCTPRSGVLTQVERLRTIIEAHKFADLEGQVTVSIGAADSAGKSSPEQIIQEADSSLYAAKRNGRNRCVIVGITA